MTEPMTPERLDEIEERAEAANSAPWSLEYSDFLFIAHARQDVPDLVAEVRRLQAENEELRRERQKSALNEITQMGYEEGWYDPDSKTNAAYEEWKAKGFPRPDIEEQS